jgi:hypothetical protein
MAAAVRVFVNAVDAYTSSHIGEVRASPFESVWLAPCVVVARVVCVCVCLLVGGSECE